MTEAFISVTSVVVARLFITMLILRFTKKEWPWHGSLFATDKSKDGQQSTVQSNIGAKYLLRAA